MLLLPLLLGLCVVSLDTLTLVVAGPPPPAASVAPQPAAREGALVDDELQQARALADQGKLVGALGAAQRVLQAAVVAQDEARMSSARVEVERLLARLPHAQFIEDPSLGHRGELRFDGRVVPGGGLTRERWSVDPGHHVLVMTSEVSGRMVTHTLELDVAEGATLVIPVASPALSPRGDGTS